MKLQRYSRGITFIGFIVMLCVLGFFAYLGMKLVPMYIEYFGVVKAMEQVKNEPGAAQMTIDQIRRDLNVKFDTQYVDEHDVTPQSIQLKREGGTSVLRIAYEKRTSFMYNIDLVASFDKSVNLTNAGAE